MKNVYGDVQEEEEPPKIHHRYNFPRPISEPPTPNISRAASPDASDDDGEAVDSHDSEEEEQELADALTEKLKTTKIRK